MLTGTKIKNTRMSKNISQKELAKKLDIPTSTLANYENNHRRINVEMLNKICKELDCSPNVFFEEKISKELLDSHMLETQFELLEALDNFYPLSTIFVNSKYGENPLQNLTIEEKKELLDSIFFTIKLKIEEFKNRK